MCFKSYFVIHCQEILPSFKKTIKVYFCFIQFTNRLDDLKTLKNISYIFVRRYFEATNHWNEEAASNFVKSDCNAIIKHLKPNLQNFMFTYFQNIVQMLHTLVQWFLKEIKQYITLSRENSETLLSSVKLIT